MLTTVRTSRPARIDGGDSSGALTVAGMGIEWGATSWALESHILFYVYSRAKYHSHERIASLGKRIRAATKIDCYLRKCDVGVADGDALLDRGEVLWVDKNATGDA